MMERKESKETWLDFLFSPDSGDFEFFVGTATDHREVGGRFQFTEFGVEFFMGELMADRPLVIDRIIVVNRETGESKSIMFFQRKMLASGDLFKIVSPATIELGCR